MDTLVLSCDWRPIASVPWSRALSDVLTNRAEIIEEYDDWIVRSARQAFPVPLVIRFRHGRPPATRKVKFSKQNVFARDNGRCQYCGVRLSLKTATYDHVLPRSRGGKTTWGNIVIACQRCNGLKGNRTPNEANMRLHSTPRRPKRQSHKYFSKKNVPERWKAYF